MLETDVAFDHYDEGFAADPYPVWSELRQRCPVAHSQAHDGFWVVTKYDDVRHVVRHPELFSSRHPSIPKDIGFGDFAIPLISNDPPEHTRLKQLLNAVFLPAQASAFEPRIRASVVGLLERLVPQGHFDASSDFARLVSMDVVRQVLDLPDEIDRYTNWMGRIVEHAGTDQMDALAAGGELLSFLNEIVAQRQADPGADTISYLLRLEIDGDRLTETEVMFTAALLFFAGIDTTWGTLASAIHHLATHPGDQARLRAEPALLETAREEFLRAFAPVNVARVVVADTELGGRTLQAGEMVLVSIPSANRDEAEFAAADQVQLDRTPNRHLAFGTGPHRCLGVNLARMELRVALEEFLRRVPPFRLEDPDAVIWTTGQIRRPKHVPLVLEGS